MAHLETEIRQRRYAVMSQAKTLHPEPFTYFVQRCPEDGSSRPVAVSASDADEAAQVILGQPLSRAGNGNPVAVVWREGPGGQKIYFYRDE